MAANGQTRSGTIGTAPDDYPDPGRTGVAE